MADSQAHRWGQIVGDVFERAFRSKLHEAASATGVYFDFNGNPRATRAGGVLRWKDENGNWHQMDYVLERGGSDTVVGAPVAFVELAWRRYTKHSKAKVQEIEGAVLPLAQTHRHQHPFLGAILAGEFTKNSLQQLLSRGFAVIYVPTPKVVDAFAGVGIDASSTEETPEHEFAAKVSKFEKLTGKQMQQLHNQLVAAEPKQVAEFMDALTTSISRTVERVLILPLHGEPHVALDVDAAIAFVANYGEVGGSKAPVHRYEIEVRYSNGALVRGAFPSKGEAVAFLRAQS